jgi:predicted small metal-binding protein
MIYCICVGMNELSCRDTGFNCNYVIKADTDEEIFAKGKEHAMMDHGMKQEELSPEFKESLKRFNKDY